MTLQYRQRVPLACSGYSVIVPGLCLVISLMYQKVGGYGGSHILHMAPISKLHELVLGEVLPCCGAKYQRRRLVNNRACLARPAVIVRPVTTEDVAISVNFAKRNGFQVSLFLFCINISGS